MSRGSRLLNNASFLGSGAAMPLVALLTAPLIARAMSPDDRGLLALGIAWISLGSYALALGQYDYVVHKMGVARGRLPWLHHRLTTGWLMLSVAALLASALSRSFWSLILLGAPLLMFTQYRRSQATALAFDAGLTKERWAQAFLRLTAVLLLFVIGGLTPASALIITILASVLASLYSFRLRNVTNSPEAAEGPGAMLRFGVAAWGASLATALLLRVDQLLLGYLVSPGELGVYVIAVGISEASLLISAILKPRLMGSIFTSGSLVLLAKYTRLLAISWPGILGVAFFTARPLIELLYGVEYSSAWRPLLILLVAALFIIVMDLNSAAFVALGRPRSSLAVSCLGAGLALAVTPVAIWAWGMEGAAAATALTYGAAAIFGRWKLSRCNAAERPASVGATVPSVVA